MSDLNIKEMKLNEAKTRDLSNFDILLKEDGTLMFYINKNLVSARAIIRNDRFAHIKQILNDYDFPECFGEMYVDQKGATVFDISSKENWSSAKFLPIDLIDKKKSYKERQEELSLKIKETNDKGENRISPLIRFETFEEGWNYVEKNEEEGLILRHKVFDTQWFKVKILREDKVKIVDWEPGSDKGCFILENGNRVSGTSVGYVKQFQEILESRGIAMAEIEFPFMTKDGHYFQPRLRRIFEIKED